MAKLESTILITRERWLPMLQLVASTYHWHIPGSSMELLIDDIALYLGQAETLEPAACMRIMQHYYQDAPTIRLLCEQSAEATSAWQALILSIRQHIAQEAHLPVPLTRVEARILARFKASLTEHNYQLALTQRLAQIVREELDKAPGK